MTSTEGLRHAVVGTAYDIAERKQAEGALRDSEARFRALTEMSSDFYWESDAVHRLTMRGSADTAVSTVSVFRAGAQIGQCRWEVPYLSPDEAGWQAHRAILDAHLPFRNFELSRLGVDGTERHITISGNPQFDADRTFTGYRGVGTDITVRKRAEAELRKLELAVRQSGTGIVITDAAGCIEFVNPKFEAMTGYSAAEAIGKNPRFLKSGTQSRDYYRNLWGTISGGKDWRGELQNRKKSGELYWESQHISPVLDDKGRILHFIAVKDDITESKRSERALRESEGKLRAIFENAVEGIFVVSREGNVLSSNAQLARMLGYASPEEMGEDIRSVSREVYVEKGARRRFRELLLNNAVVEDFETQWRRKDGSTFWVSLSARLLREESEGSIHHVGMARDISERRLAQEKISRLNRVYAVLSRTNALIVRVSSKEELFREACRIAVEAGQFSAAWVATLDRKSMEVRPVAWQGVDEPYVDAARRAMSGATAGAGGLAALAMREKRPIISNDLATDPLALLREQSVQLGSRALVALPLLIAGEAAGVFVLHAREPGYFNDDEMQLLLELAGDISFAMKHIEQSEKVDYLAYYDPLTSLANRSLFQERLSQFLESSKHGDGKLALALLDIDRFKAVNDSLGRHSGDELLRQFAECVSRAVGPTQVARIGADQFAVILPAVKGRHEAVRQIEELAKKCLGHPYRVGDAELRVSARLGVALYPNHAGDADTLLQNAEAALKKARETGERYAFYTSDLTKDVAETLKLETRLRQALERNEFVLHYQPKVDLASGQIAGVEALIRWSSPELGLVPPAQFIPLMESTGLIQEVGAWALQKAIEDHLRWRKSGLQAPRVAVNVSAMQLRRTDFFASVKQAVARGANPPGIDLEITESLVMRDIEDNIEKLRLVRDLGLHIAIDDFGTGYSSLGYLAKLPVQALKIDRSFILTMHDDPNTMTLVSTMISLAHSLRLKVIAEGVESQEQAKFLRLLRCDEMQGYVFSKPLPFDELTALLVREQRPKG